MESGIHNPYLNSRQDLSEETHSTISQVDAPTRSVVICGHSQETGVSYPENFSPPPALLGFGDLRAAPDEEKTLTDADLTYYSRQESASDQSHLSSHVGVTPNVSITSAIPSSSIVQRASRYRSHISKITRKKRAEVSSRSSRQFPGMHEAPKGTYVCHTCGKRYAQPSGVMRHYRAEHNPNSCTYCGAKWSRPYQYRDHLEKHHRDVDPDLVLGKPPGSRQRAKVIGRGRPQNVSPHVVNYNRQSLAARRPPPMPPLPAVMKVPQAHLAFSSAEEPELVQLVNDVVDHSSRLPRALLGEFTTADCSSRPVSAHIPLPCPTSGGYYGDLLAADLDLFTRTISYDESSRTCLPLGSDP